MIKTLRSSLGRDREKFKIPRSVQQSVPVRQVWPDGILRVGNQFSKCFTFSDINYAIASDEDKESAFYKYSDVLNALDSENVKITIHNRKQDQKGWKKISFFHSRRTAWIYTEKKRTTA